MAKLYAYWITVSCCEAYGSYACNGILFNHESRVLGETFVMRSITRALVRIKLGLQNSLYLGNLDAKRNWGQGSRPFPNFVCPMRRHCRKSCVTGFETAINFRPAVGFDAAHNQGCTNGIANTVAAL